MVEMAFAGIPPGKYSGSCVLPCRSMSFCKGIAGITPKGEGRLVGSRTLRKKLQAASAVEKVPLGKRAVSSMSAKGGKISSGEPSAVENDKRMHMAVG